MRVIKYVYGEMDRSPVWSSGQVPGYISRDPGFDSRRYQTFCDIVDLERALLSLVRIIEEMLQ
jgi:hypothetical protein